MSLVVQPTLSHYLVLGAILFAISVIGIFLNRRNVIIMLMALELMLLAVNLNFIAFSRYLNDTAGQIFVFFILTVAAAESAGLDQARRWHLQAVPNPLDTMNVSSPETVRRSRKKHKK